MEVAALQQKLRRNLNHEVRANASPSSLQLTLEDPMVLAAVERYVKQLAPRVEDKKDVIGFAYAVNGKAQGGELYASHALFIKLWPKLLRATAVEAVAELVPEKKFTPVTLKDVQALMADAEKGKASSKKVALRCQVEVRETPRALLVETKDKDNQPSWVHRSYLKK
jgi:hypothetical protein